MTALNVVSALSGGGGLVEGEGVVGGVKGIICAATVWPQRSGCGQLATTNLGEKAAASRWLKLASHRTRDSVPNPSDIRSVRRALHLFQCDAGELQQSCGQWDRVKVYKTGCHHLALPAPRTAQSGPTKYNKVAEHNKGCTVRNIKV